MSRKVSGVMAGWLAAASVAVAQTGGSAGTPPAVKGKTLSPYYATASTLDWSGDEPMPELLPPVPSTPVIPAAPAPKAMPAAAIQQASAMQPATPPVPQLPPTTPPPTTPPPTTPPPGNGACGVSVAVNAWNNGLTENITITNTGATAVNGWSLGFALPAGQSITSGWNATYAPNSGQVTARNVAYNGTIAVNGSVTIGFQATHTGNTAKPTSFTLNGASCTLA
jgi:cellulase/cellobiase CelA1